jgi:UPF0271 protein
MQIDLNSDLGEGFGPWAMGDDTAMLDLVSSANIACGGHAGDAETMFATLRAAAARGVVVGAHPGYADPAGFGRRVIPMAAEEIARMVVAQVGALQAMARLAGTRVAYVKPHGALANYLADRRDVSDVLVAALTTACPDLAILAISGTELELAARAADRPVYSEIFADRGYLANGRLVPRHRPEALIHDPEHAAFRLIGYLKTGRMPVVDGPPIRLQAQSICVHGDSPGAVAMAQTIRARLTEAGMVLAPFLTPLLTP